MMIINNEQRKVIVDHFLYAFALFNLGVFNTQVHTTTLDPDYDPDTDNFFENLRLIRCNLIQCSISENSAFELEHAFSLESNPWSSHS